MTVIAIGSVLITRSTKSPRNTTTVPTVRVQTGTLERTLRLSGSTVGENSVTVLAPYLRGSRTRGGGSGRFHLVLQELAPDGSRVEAGDRLALFDRESMLQQIDDLTADKLQAQGNLRVLEAKLAANREVRDQQIRVAKAGVETAALDLKTAPVRSAIQADMFKLALDEARTRYGHLLAEAKDFDVSQSSQIRTAQLAVRQAESEVQRAESNAERMIVRASRPGLVVIRQTVRNGEYATIRAGDELRPGQPYLDIVAPGPMIVDATVNQVDVRKLRVGAPAEVVPEAFPDIRLSARVTAIGSMAVSNGFRGEFVREVPVRLRVDGSDPRVIPSLTVAIDVVVDQMNDVPLVSRSAIFPQSRDGEIFAIVEGPEGWERRHIHVGLINSTTAAVIGGLKDGDVAAMEMPADFED